MSYTNGDTVKVTAGDSVMIGEVENIYDISGGFDLLMSNGISIYICPDDWDSVEALKKKVTLPTMQRAVVVINLQVYILLGDYWYHTTEGTPIPAETMQTIAENATYYRVVFGGEE